MWLNDLFSYDFEQSCWSLIEAKGKPPFGRLQHSSVIQQDKLYIFGGEPDRLRQLNDLFVFNIGTLNQSHLDLS